MIRPIQKILLLMALTATTLTTTAPKNVADIRVDGGKIIFTDLMGIRYTFDGTLEKVDLMDNYVIVRG